jgi:hypothetical protein
LDRNGRVRLMKLREELRITPGQAAKREDQLTLLYQSQGGNGSETQDI